MYKEINKRKNNFAFILAFVLCFLFFAYIVIRFLPVAQLLKDIVLLGVLAWFVLVFINRFLAEYEYELAEDRIIFRMKTGGRERNVIVADICDLMLLCRANDERLKDFKVSSKIMCTAIKTEYAALFKDNETFLKVVFAPSEKMLGLIEQKMKTLCGEE